MLKTLSLTLITIIAAMALTAPAFAGDADTQTGETHDCVFKRIVADHPELFGGGIKQAALSHSNPILTFSGVNNRGQH